MWGLPCPRLYSRSGALLPHLFTLTPARRKQAPFGLSRLSSVRNQPRVTEAVSSLWHWPSRSLDAAIPDVIRHTALRSSDFPPPVYSLRRNRQRPPSSLALSILPRIDFHQRRNGVSDFTTSIPLIPFAAKRSWTLSTASSGYGHGPTTIRRSGQLSEFRFNGYSM